MELNCPEGYCTSREYAEAMGVPLPTVTAQINTCKIPSVRVGAYLYVPIGALPADYVRRPNKQWTARVGEWKKEAKPARPKDTNQITISESGELIMPKKVLIALPPAMLEQVDYIAQCEHRTRSDTIREALRDYIDKHKRKTISLQTQQPQLQYHAPIVTENIMQQAKLGTASNRYDNGETYDGPLVP